MYDKLSVWPEYILPAISTADNDTVRPDRALRLFSSFVNAPGSGASISKILFIPFSSLLRRLLRESADFLPLWNWQMESLYMSWSWLEIASILKFDDRSLYGKCVSWHIVLYVAYTTAKSDS